MKKAKNNTNSEIINLINKNRLIHLHQKKRERESKNDRTTMQFFWGT